MNVFRYKISNIPMTMGNRCFEIKILPKLKIILIVFSSLFDLPAMVKYPRRRPDGGDGGEGGK